MTRALPLAVVLVATTACRPMPTPSEVLERQTAGATASERLPLVVLLHGYGGTPANVVGLLDGLGVRARVIAPHGPVHVDAGRGWFPLDWMRSSDEVAPEITAAAKAVLEAVGHVSRTKPTCGLPIVVGFSQGGFLSYAIAARAPDRIAAALPVAGMLPPSLRPTSNRDGAGPRIVAFHGESDHVVDLREDRDTSSAFVAHGFAATLRTYPGVAHSVTQDMRADLQAVITEVVAAQGCAR